MKRTTNLTLEQHIAEVREAWHSILSIPRPPASYFERLLKHYTVSRLLLAFAYVGREYTDLGCGDATGAIEAYLSDWDRDTRIKLEKENRRLLKALGLPSTKRPAKKSRVKKDDLQAAYELGQQNFALAVEMVSAQIATKGGTHV